MRFINNRTIRLNKVLNLLDKFVLRFVRILERHTSYVIVSGYVSILLGRARATDDVDILIAKMSEDDFELLYRDLLKDGLWCINSSILGEVYDLLVSKIGIRFAPKGQSVPNVELKFLDSKYDKLALDKFILVKVGGADLKISHLELQIAFKEEVLKSNKDLEDARHLRGVAEGHLDEGLIESYKKELKEVL